MSEIRLEIETRKKLFKRKDQAEIIERRQRVKEMYLKPLSRQVIAKGEGVSEDTIKKDLRTLRRRGDIP